MYISKLHLKNFKKFENITFEFNNGLNILTGENSCGKSSVLDALSIWYECFSKSIYQMTSGHSLKGKNKNLRKNDWSFREQKIQEFKHYRTSQFKDIKTASTTSKSVTLSLTINIDGEEIVLGFDITDTLTNVSPKIEENGLIKFNEHFSFTDKTDLINKFYINLIMPMITIVQPNELEISDNHFKNELLRGNGINWIKNRLYKTTNDNLGHIERALQSIFDNNSISIKIDYDPKSTIEFIGVYIKGFDSSEYDLSLMGSGFLQTLNIVLDLYSNHNGYKMYLLDEPDSHLHRGIQHKFLSFLQSISKNNNIQIIITTHSIPMIRKANINELFHIEEDTLNKVCKPVSKNELMFEDKIGFQGSSKVNVYNSLGIDSTSSLIDAIEAKRIVFVEGSDDAYMLKSIGKYYLKTNVDEIYFWTLKGASDVLMKMKYYKDILSQISNGATLWSKSLLVLDRDSLIDSEVEDLQNNIRDSLNIESFFWDTYAIENQFFKDIHQLKTALSKIEPNLDADTLLKEALLSQYDFEKLKNLDNTEFTKLEQSFFGQRLQKANEYKKLDFKNNKFISSLEKDGSKKASTFLRTVSQDETIVKYIKLKNAFSHIATSLNIDEIVLIDKLVQELPKTFFSDIANFIFDEHL